MATWLEKCRLLTEEVSRTLFTYGEFSKALSDLVEPQNSSLSGLALEWENPITGDTLILGRPSEGSEDFRERRQEFDATIRVWARKDDVRPSTLSASDIAREIWACFGEFLARQDLNPISGLRDFKGSQRVRQLLEERVSICIQCGQRCAFLYFDLDGFKEVNDKISHEQGDIVIGRFANFLVKVCGQSTALLHNGGDEFLGFYPDADPEDAADLALEILTKSKQFDFQSRGIPVGVSIGIACYPSLQRYESLSDLVNAADSALKSVKSGVKGTTRFPPETGTVPHQTEQALKLATCLVKSSVGTPRVRTFSSPWLNVLADRVSRALTVCDLSSSDIPKLLQDFLGAAQLEINNVVLAAQRSQDSGVDTHPVASLVDIGIALANGVFHAAARHEGLRQEVSGLTVRFTDDSASLVTATGHVVWTEGPLEKEFRAVDLGSCWGSDASNQLDSDSGRMAILAQIGHQDLGVPMAVLAGRVVIDDRPTRGGGLPDFWELTLGRILDLLNSHPNVTKIFVMGDSQWGKQSLEWLTNTDRWDNRYVEYKTTLPLEVIERVKARLAGNVHVVASLDEMVDVLLSVAQSPRSLHGRPEAPGPRGRTGFLSREIHMSGMALRPKDGCRVNTIAEAYVVVLELLRRQSAEDDIVLDQAAQPLKELSDFKVELLDPLRDMVPDFYKADQSQLDEYYSREFRTDGGIFWEEVRKHGQYDKVVAHITETLSRAPSPHTTRRAILVIPHTPPSHGELAPLGLVAIRCIPRITGRSALLHFSYVWRTVEALVGFPYSLYGSVRFASDLVADVQAALSTEVKSVTVKLGRVSYIALSLHMFRDEFALQIARRIVNDATA